MKFRRNSGVINTGYIAGNVQNNPQPADDGEHTGVLNTGHIAGTVQNGSGYGSSDQRAVAANGTVIEVKDGKVYINGESV